VSDSSGTLFWYSGKVFGGRDIRMLIKTERVEWERYKYRQTFLTKDGYLSKVITETEKVENDDFWGEYYERIKEDFR
jgi:hypothetical protein